MKSIENQILALTAIFSTVVAGVAMTLLIHGLASIVNVRTPAPHDVTQVSSSIGQ